MRWLPNLQMQFDSAVSASWVRVVPGKSGWSRRSAAPAISLHSKNWPRRPLSPKKVYGGNSRPYPPFVIPIWSRSMGSNRPADDRHAEFTLEYIDGPDIVGAVREEGPSLLLDLAAEALRALSFLHDFGLIHRDLKPANLLVRRQPRIGCRLVVLDFGLAMRGQLESEDIAGPAGTLPYMAPELFSGTLANRKTDLYALGSLLFEAVHGRPPFDPDPQDLAGFIERVNEGKRSRPALPSGFPVGLETWLEELLSPDPAERPAGAVEALARLNATCGCEYEVETRETRLARLESGPPPGRDEELEELRNSVSSKDECHLVWLAGDAGSGKTRVLRWLASEVVGRGWAVEHGLSSGSTLLTTEREHSGGEGEGVILLDEAETAPPNLVSLLNRLAREPAGPPVNIVVALRPAEIRSPELRQLLDDSDLLPGARRINLEPLTPDQIGKVLQRASGARSALPHRVKWLHEASEGNALLLESLIAEESWEHGKPPARTHVIEQSIARRLSGLTPDAVRWFETLAVLGNDSPGDWIQEVGKFSADASRVASEELRQARIVSVTDGRWSTTSRVFAEGAIRAMDPDRRLSVSRSSAEFLENTELVKSDPGRLARLWAASGNRAQARIRAIEAADCAERNDRHSEAADWLRLALVQLDRRCPERYALRRRHAFVLVAALRHREAYKALITCLRVARDPEDRAELMAEKARSLMALTRYREVIEVASEARGLATAAELPVVAALCLRVTGMAMFRLGMFEEAIPVLANGADGVRERRRRTRQGRLRLSRGNLRIQASPFRGSKDSL